MRTATLRIFTGSYSFVRRTGLLNTGIGSRLFTSAYFLYKRYIEDSLAALARAQPSLFRGGNILDVGANIGYTATILATALDPGRRVFAFEPEPFNFGLLQRTAHSQEFREVIKPVQCAVGAEEGTVELWLNENHHADHHVVTDTFRATATALRSVSVPMVSLDSFLEQNPGPVCFIKIDVQGFELPVCEGMKSILEQNPAVSILLEYDPAGMKALGFDPSRLLTFFAQRGLTPFIVRHNGTHVPAVIPDIEAQGGYVDLLFRRSLNSV
jgi:FkbM family methyltransferase